MKAADGFIVGYPRSIAIRLSKMQDYKPLPLCWRSVDTLLTLCWHSVDALLTLCWRSVDTLLMLCWHSVDALLALILGHGNDLVATICD